MKLLYWQVQLKVAGTSQFWSKSDKNYEHFILQREQPLPCNRRINNGVMQPVSKQQIRKHVPVVTNTHAIYLVLETVFSDRSVQSGYKEANWGN
jgi:hypothetical protein